LDLSIKCALFQSNYDAQNPGSDPSTPGKNSKTVRQQYSRDETKPTLLRLIRFRFTDALSLVPVLQGANNGRHRQQQQQQRSGVDVDVDDGYDEEQGGEGDEQEQSAWSKNPCMALYARSCYFVR
jgi:hypothetical protein